MVCFELNVRNSVYLSKRFFCLSLKSQKLPNSNIFKACLKIQRFGTILETNKTLFYNHEYLKCYNFISTFLWPDFIITLSFALPTHFVHRTFLFSFSISIAIILSSFHRFCYNEEQKWARKEYLKGKPGAIEKKKGRLYCNMSIHYVDIMYTFLWSIWPQPLPEKENQVRWTFYQHQYDCSPDVLCLVFTSPSLLKRISGIPICHKSRIKMRSAVRARRCIKG